MKKLALILSFLVSLVATAQTFTTTTLSGDYSRPGAGTERWNETSGTQTVSGYPAVLDYYRRFTIRDFLNEDGTTNFTKFDSKLHAAMDARQKFSFGVMQGFPYGDGNFNWLSTFSGTDQRTGTTKSGNAAYPLAWHTAMQAETIKDWIGESGDWVHNHNSASYLTKWNALHAAINTHLQTGSYQPGWAAAPIPYKNVIGYIDIRGYGSYGEWHVALTAPGNNYQNFPSGTFPTVASYKSIIDAQVNNYQDFRLVMITNSLDGLRLGNTGTPVEIAHYLYTRTTTKGFVGFRMDHFGDHTGDDELADDSYDDFQLQKNSHSFSGYRFDTAFNNRFKLAPFYGEPPGGPTSSFGVVQGVFPRQVRKWHVTMVGNGNFGQGNTPTGQSADSVRQGYRTAGYHLRVTGGDVVSAATLTINLKWRNFGLTPTYENWLVQYSLRNGAGTTVWTGNSSFDPYLFLPEYGEVTKTSTFAKPAIAAGSYGLYVTVKDPLDYRLPLPLQITGRETATGSYFLTNITIPSGTANRPPVANAGANLSIIQPDDDATVTGTATDPDGTIASYAWSQVSGPSTATINSPTTASTTIDNLTTIGNYIFDFTVTDNSGSTSSDQITITVAATPNVAPVSNPGNPQTIQLPDTDAALSAAASTDSDGTITGFLWFLFSGPDVVGFSAATSSSTNVTGLKEGIYFIGLQVTDDDGLTDTRVVQITVLGIPVQHSKPKWQRKFRAF